MRPLTIPALVLTAGLLAALPVDGPPAVVVEVPSPMPAAWQEIKVAQGKLVRVKTKDDRPARWVLVDDHDADLDVAADGRSAGFVARKPGTYRALAWAEGGDPGRIKYVVDGGTPDPDPEPGPDPTPAGVVKSFVVVEDTLAAGTFRADILGSARVQAVYKNRGLTHRVVDANIPTADLDAVGRKYQAAAKGRALPVVWTFDGPNFTGTVLVDGAPCPKTEDGFLAALGGGDAPRKMGAMKLARLKRDWKVFGEHPAVPLVRRADWKEVDYSAFLPPVYDQDGRGQCASSAACSILETARAMAGLPSVKLSAGDLYSRVNGGRDDGSTLEDNLYELLTNGVAPASVVPYVWDGRVRNDPATKAERLKYRIAEVYLCRTFDALASANMLGFVCEEALDWYDNFTPDADGWLPRRGRGGVGGHALTNYGLKRAADGTWGSRTRNSWSAAWGAHGNCVIPESLLDDTYGGFWAVRAVSQTAEVKRPPSPFGLTPEYALAP